MQLQDILQRYQSRFFSQYGHRLKAEQRSALYAMLGCRQGQYGKLILNCQACHQYGTVPRSCGHRACNQCQHQSTQHWLDRQLRKQLPVDYFMTTFTLPPPLRALAKAHPRTVYNVLMQSAATTLKRFGLNKKDFSAETGMCVVLHTHTRQLDYHPHVHIVVPGGGVNRARREFRKIRGKYLFNGKALAKAFRGEFLHQVERAGLHVPATPYQWVVQCQKVGQGVQALRYLARYLYRGVLSNQNIVSDDGTFVCFRYKESKTNKWQSRTLRGEELIHRLLQHVLPKGFRRARDYGFLHGNAKSLMKVIQWVFKIERPESTKQKRATYICPHCTGTMYVIGFKSARASP